MTVDYQHRFTADSESRVDPNISIYMYISQHFSWITDGIGALFRSWPVPGRGGGRGAQVSFGAPRAPRLIGVAWLKGSPARSMIPFRAVRRLDEPETPGSLKRRATRDPGSRYISKSPGVLSLRTPFSNSIRRYWDIDSTRSTSRAISPRSEQAGETKDGMEFRRIEKRMIPCFQFLLNCD